MQCTCGVVNDGEGGTVIKHCAIHKAAPELLRVLMQLLSTIRAKEEGSVVAYGKQTMDQLVEEALTDAKRIVKPLAPLYYERPRGIRDTPDAGEPHR